MIKTYSQALDYIYSFVDFSLTRNLRYSPEKFDLSRMREFLRLMGNPQKHYKVIHVAGTKGKGSTCAMLASILNQNGFTTGFYSSPHMIDLAERFRIGNKLISHSDIINYLNELKPQIEKVPELTTFEILTGLAFKYFADRRAQFGVIEVGMGGRFDATNVVNPLISVITSISHDHTKVLGKTLKKIAFEKAGIIKKGIPVVVAKQKTSPLAEIRRIAYERKSELIYVPNQFEVKSVSYSLEGQDIYFQEKQKQKNHIFIPLAGDHQIDNALTAYACIGELKKQGIEINSEAITAGFKNVNWPGRFEVINKKPLAIIDSAHNLDSFRKMAATIRKYLPGKKIILIFGASEDKEVEAMLKIVKPLINTLIITKSEHPRAMDVNKIKSYRQSIRNPFSIRRKYNKCHW